MTAGSTVALHHLLEGPEDAPVMVLSNSLGATLAPSMASPSEGWLGETRHKGNRAGRGPDMGRVVLRAREKQRACAPR